jgi:hypothetical protein
MAVGKKRPAAQTPTAAKTANANNVPTVQKRRRRSDERDAEGAFMTLRLSKNETNEER